MRKTKIVCTLGPATDREGVLRDMICAGMNVARFNFSHGTHEDHARRLAQLQKLRDELDMPVAALLDTKGPEIRLRDFKNGRVQLKAGQTFTLTTREVMGDENICSITYKELPQDVCPGARILLDDGLIALTVKDIDGGDIVCTVKNDGPVSNHKGVNVPDVHLSMPYMTAQDKDDIRFGVEQGFDFIAASFVRSAADVLEIRRVLDECKCDFIKIIAKIENREGVNNIEEILSVSDGIMAVSYTHLDVYKRQHGHRQAWPRAGRQAAKRPRGRRRADSGQGCPQGSASESTGHSWRMASSALIFTARLAGAMPLSTPTTVANTSASRMSHSGITLSAPPMSPMPPMPNSAPTVSYTHLS